jgi:serine/threonine-protein kinase RIO1
MKKVKFYTAREVADEILDGVSYKHVLSMCKEKKIDCIKSGSVFKMTAEAVYKAFKIEIIT